MNRLVPPAPAALVAALLVLSACSGGGGQPGGPAAPSVLPSAPEPAVSPPLTTVPAGHVTTLPAAPDPEGLVVDAAGVVAMATRDPDRLALLDADGTLLRFAAVPGSARHLQLAGPAGPVLVPGEDTDLVSEVELPGGRVLRSTRVGRQPHDAASTGGGSVVVTDELGMAVTVLRDGAVVATFPGPVQPGGVAADGGRAGVVDVRGRQTYVYAGDPAARVAVVPAGAGPTHAVDLGGGVLAVADTTGGAIVVTRISGTPAVLATVPLPGRPYGMAVDLQRHRLWVATGSDNRLVRIDIGGPPADPTLTVGPSFPTVRQPNSVAVRAADGRVYVAGATRPGTLQVLDPGP